MRLLVATTNQDKLREIRGLLADAPVGLYSLADVPPITDPEENLVHQAAQSPLFREAAYCASCHFDKVKDVTQKSLPGEILQGTVCQDCHRSEEHTS